MSAGAWSGAVRRVVTPSGLLLALICFAFPFVSVSCGTTTVDYSGWDLVVGDTPRVTTEGKVVRQATGWASEPVPIQPLALATFVIILICVVAVLHPRVEPLLRAVVACGAASLLMVNQAVVYRAIVEEVRNSGERSMADGVAEGMVRARYGFWLTLAVLLGVAAYNVAEVLWRARARDPAAVRAR
jgi:hypothetical protein